MNWIVFSDNDPELLHLHLETASIHLPYGKPTVIMPSPNGEATDAYRRLATRFSARWIILPGNDYSQGLVDFFTEHCGTARTEAMTLLTDTSTYFSGMVDMRATWGLLQDDTILGVSLVESPATCDHAMQQSPGSDPAQWMWYWPFTNYTPFSLGRTYRTNDLMGLMYFNADWQNLSDLEKVSSNCPGFTRRAYLACFGKAPMKRVPMPRDENAIRMYLRNFTIDVTRLSDGSYPYQWKPYGG